MARSRKTIERDLRKLIEDVRQHDVPDVGPRLAALGFGDSEGAVQSFRRVVERLVALPTAIDSLATLLTDLQRSPDPGAALLNLTRYLETSGASGALLETLSQGKPIREILATIFGASQYLSDIIIRNPGYIYWLIEQRTWDEPDSVEAYLDELERDIAGFATSEGRLGAVRRFHRRIMLKIGLRDLLGDRTIEATTAALSALACAVLQSVLSILWRDLADAEGHLPADPSFAVIAMGKLGGNELNYSSDIDLIYVCGECEDDVVATYTKLARRLTEALTEITPEGYLYRVDLRLRPDGKAGPLVNTVPAMRIYYENRGRPWEFQAMLKARVVAGDRRVGEDLLDFMSGLVFNPSLSYSPLEDIAVMRHRIRENISTRERALNIKLMEGGIRDIEFIVQTMQLMYGNKYPELRVSNSIDGINRSYEKKLIKKVERDTLVAAYRFLRLVEHRLQMMHQIKTHSIPESESQVRMLAGRVSCGPLGRFSYERFLTTLSGHLNKIRLLSDSFFAGDRLPEPTLMLLLPGSDNSAAKTLADFGQTDPGRALPVIRSLAYGSFPDLVDRHTRASFQRLLKPLLDTLSKAGDPTAALINFAKVAAAARNVATFYDLLFESPSVRTLLCDLLSVSSLLTNKLCRHLEVLDALMVDPESLVGGTAGDEVRWEALTAVGLSGPPPGLFADIEQALDRRAIGAWVLDAANVSLPAVMSRVTTDTVRSLIGSAFDHLVEEPQGAALFAMGSFAVGEPAPSSDVDVLVVTKERDSEFMIKRVQRLNQLFSDSGLLKIDFRLRGEGANAPLVQDLSFYQEYFATRMSTWERVAYAKCAHWAGDPALAAEFTSELAPRVTGGFTRSEVRELVDMRSKLETLAPAGGELLDTKRAVGGRYDIEFMCAIALARAGEAYSLDTPTAERLRVATAAGVLDAGQEAALVEALTLCRRIDYFIDLQQLAQTTSAARTAERLRYLDRTFELLGMTQSGGIAATLTRVKQTVRACFDEVVKKSL